MAEFIKVMKVWRRMCVAAGEVNGEDEACDNCPLKDFNCTAIFEDECDKADWSEVERKVTKWAAEHPEPVYPTWGEYIVNSLPQLREVGCNQYQFVSVFWGTPIQAEIAQKLGLQPKEDAHEREKHK